MEILIALIVVAAIASGVFWHRKRKENGGSGGKFDGPGKNLS
jgi:hypothetical protein